VKKSVPAETAGKSKTASKKPGRSKTIISKAKNK
jgi:hypothetical protein